MRKGARPTVSEEFPPEHQSPLIERSAALRLCEWCRKPIPAARLEALPEATSCVGCAAKHPKKLDTSFVDLSEASPINRNGFAPKD